MVGWVVVCVWFCCSDWILWLLIGGWTLVGVDLCIGGFGLWALCLAILRVC